MLQVTCAIIEHANKILICQRSASMKLPLKWEFPGGKIETGESKEGCSSTLLYAAYNLEK
ncbi:NUDIX domain-containing protein [Sphingobacterium athyrii]|uniref:NUDIX domain-containing protein n=1 Tax=Sphingobacterium athyrii TaxID=2152717 RepID=UPI001FE75180|nr:NUDIX domain-containing protein [Sphingobacterium athyrii]